MYVHEQCPGTLHQQIQNKGEDQTESLCRRIMLDCKIYIQTCMISQFKGYIETQMNK